MMTETTPDIRFEALGTLNYIKLYDDASQNILEQAVKRVLEIDDMMSAYKEYSDISLINGNAGNGFTNINRDTLHLLNRSLQFSRMSEGAFDITVRPLIDLWGIGKKANYIPDEESIRHTLQFVNSHNLILDHINTRAALSQKGQSLDLGGIAKGYAADEVKRILLENNIQNAIINLGGNIVTLGNRPDGSSWRIGIQDPFSSTGNHIGILRVQNKTIVTSGVNERFFVKDGVRYHHILDPRSGKPAQNSLMSVTAILDCSMDADALTTALFVLGMEKSTKLLKLLNAEAIFITNTKDVFVTEGLKGDFELFNERPTERRVI